MFFRVKNGKSILLIELNISNRDFPGSGLLHVPFDIGRKYLERGPNSLNDFGQTQEGTVYNWDLLESDGKEIGDDCAQLVDADSWIYLFHKLSQEKGVFQFKMDMENPYWLFHDLVHAKMDIDNDYLLVDAEKEIRAYILGAQDAKKHGVSNWLIWEALSSICDYFKQQFNRHPETWPEFNRYSNFVAFGHRGSS